MREYAPLAALLLLVLLGGCAGLSPGDSGDSDVETDPVADDSPVPTEADFAFEEVGREIGFEYSSLLIGAVNGNNGVYANDFDGDLQTDLLAIGGGDPTLFRNVGGEFEQTDAVPSVSGDVQGALFFDHDNDGSEDLLLLRRGDTPVFLENQDGTFQQRDVGFDREFVVPVTASAADYDGDGCLDVFVADYNDWLEEQPKGWQFTFEFDEDNGNPNALYRGSCGSFARQTDAGIEGEHWSLATSFVDFTGDGLPDVHVANDYYNDTFYTNQGDGTFERETLAGETDRNGMSSRAVDLTYDGRLDLFVTNIYYPPTRYEELPETVGRRFIDFMSHRVGQRNEGNNLLVNTGDGFAYEGAERNVSRGGWGWGSALDDFDSNGRIDVVHATQFEAKFAERSPTYTRPMLFAQHGEEFVRLNASAIGFEEGDDRGVAAMDVGRTGAMDLAIAADHEEYRFYRNDAEQGSSLQVVVRAGSLDHTSVGTRVEATTNNVTRLQVKNAKVDYQSQGSRTLHFGLGDAEQVDELRVEWPDGTVRTFEDVDVGQRVLITPDGIQQRLPYQERGG